MDLNNIRVARSETARDINRKVVLNLIRTHQPISRADLARQSGLQRSTVSAITEQLIAEKWVREGAIGDLPRGRKPTFIHLNEERAGVIGINIRPGATTIALADLSGSFVSQKKIETKDNFSDFLQDLVREIRLLLKSNPQMTYEGIGVSIPGRADPRTQKVIFAPNLQWGQFDLKTPLERMLKLPVVIENAATACALAELWFGKLTQNIRNLATVTVSDGVGVGLVINGESIRGNMGIAGEYGHIILHENGNLCRCGKRGCWESFASNSAAVRYFAGVDKGKKNGGAENASPPVFSDLIQLVQQGNAKATQAIERMAKYLGEGLAKLIMSVDPEVILIVGEVTTLWELVEPIIRENVRDNCPAEVVTRIVPHDQRTQPRLRGSVALILQQHFGMP